MDLFNIKLFIKYLFLQNNFYKIINFMMLIIIKREINNSKERETIILLVII